MAIFAIIASITSAVLYQSLQTEKRSNEKINLINNMQLAFALFSKDTRQIVTRSVRGNQMHLFLSFIGESDYLEFTRGGNVNPNAEEKRSTLVRIAYLCKDGNFVRRIWEQLDTPNRDNYQDHILLTNLKSCAFAYIGMHQNVVPTWYQYTSNKKNQISYSPLPEAIQLTLNCAMMGKINQNFPL